MKMKIIAKIKKTKEFIDFTCVIFNSNLSLTIKKNSSES